MIVVNEHIQIYRCVIYGPATNIPPRVCICRVINPLWVGANTWSLSHKPKTIIYIAHSNVTTFLATFTWTLFAMIRHWVLSPSSATCTRPSRESLSQKVTLRTSQTQKRRCCMMWASLMSSIAWMMWRPWMSVLPSNERLWQKITLEYLCLFGNSAERPAGENRLSQISTRARKTLFIAESPE